MNELVTIIQGEQMSDSNNDLQFTTSELNELAYSIGQDFSLSDIGDIHAVNESVNSEKSSVLQHDDDTGQEMVHHSHQHQDHSDQQHGHSNQHNNIDLDMDTIVIETINNEMDMNDAVVFDNVANEVSISSTGNDKSNLANTGSMANAQSGQRLTQRQQIKPAKIRAPTAQQQQQQLSRQSNQIQQRQGPVGTTQPQIISSFNLNQIGQGTQLFTVVPQKQLQQQQKGKVIKKSPIITSGLANQEPGSTLKVIYTSQGQQIVFSPSKTATTTGSGSVNLINTNATGNKVIAIGNGSSTGKLISLPGTSSPSGKVLIKPVGDTKTVSSSGQPQQVIILSSPIKTSVTTGTGSSPIVQTGKLISSQSKSPQRPLAPAPPVPKIAISKSTTSTITSDGKSVQLIRVVPVSTSQTLQTSGSFTQASKFIPLRPIAPNTKDGTGIGLASGSSSGTGMHKVLVPASALKALSGTPISVNSGTNQVSQGTLLAATGPGGTGQVFMLPNTPLLKIASPSGTVQAVSAVTSKTVTFAATSTPLITSQRTNFVPIAPSPITANSTVGLTGHLNQMKITNGTIKQEEPHQRKPCNCTKSQCLKLYCDCFANGEFCSSCNCISCHNNLEHEEDRQKAIRQCLERNPQAFHPKIGKGRAGDLERRHTKGCNCRRSGCLKNYCECYEAKILCSGLCKCVGCKNFEESFERKTLMHLADAAEVRSAQQTVATKNRLWGNDFRPKLPIRIDNDRYECVCITPEIIEATCQCLLAQAEQGERNNLDYKTIESLVLEEFGRCLTQIIDCANQKRNSKIKQELY